MKIENAGLLPRQWTIVTWLFFLVWLGLTGWGNSPVWQSHPATKQAQFDLRGYRVDGTKISKPDYEFTSLVGWPITFLHIDYPAFQVSRFNLPMAIVNIVLIVLTLAAVVFVSQRLLNQFSILHLAIATFFIAVVCALGDYVIPDYGLSTFIYSFLFVYLSPLAIAVYLFYRIGNKTIDS